MKWFQIWCVALCRLSIIIYFGCCPISTSCTSGDVLSMTTSAAICLLYPIRKCVSLEIWLLDCTNWPPKSTWFTPWYYRDQYNDVLTRQWVDIFNEIFSEDNYTPIYVECIEEYTNVVTQFPIQDENLERVCGILICRVFDFFFADGFLFTRCFRNWW